MKKTVGKIGVAVLVIVVYFFVWRPVRVATTQHLVKPLSAYILSDGDSNIHLDNNSKGVSFGISWGNGQQQQTIGYRPSTGFFFLIALVSMVFITSDLTYYLYLVGFHLGSFLLVLLFLVFGLHSIYIGFWAAELMISYLIPVFSMAYIPWLIYLKKIGRIN